MITDEYFKETQQELSDFSSNLFEKHKEKAIRLIMESIKMNLKPIPKNLGRDFDYLDIVRCSRANTYMGDETKALVNEALERLKLTDVFPSHPLSLSPQSSS